VASPSFYESKADHSLAKGFRDMLVGFPDGLQFERPIAVSQANAAALVSLNALLQRGAIERRTRQTLHPQHRALRGQAPFEIFLSESIGRQRTCKSNGSADQVARIPRRLASALAGGSMDEV
jgi:hypothetical protein